jgi:polyisoprenoid-binding protein YceI
MRSVFALFCFTLLAFGHSGTAALTQASNPPPATAEYKIDPARSKFMVIAPRGGLGWFKGHSHYLAVRNFDGTAQLTTDAINPASLQIRISAASIEETGADFTPQQKGIIKKELEDIVLETGKYPDIIFKSTKVTGTLKNGAFEVKIAGDMTLHGVTRHIVIPASVTVEGDTLRAKGEFKLNRKKFGVNATDAFHGFVRVRHTLKFTFDIIAQRT